MDQNQQNFEKQINIQYYSYKTSGIVEKKLVVDTRINLQNLQKLLYQEFIEPETRQIMSFLSFRENCYIINGESKINSENFQPITRVTDFKLEEPNHFIKFLQEPEQIKVVIPSQNRNELFKVNPDTILPSFLDILQQRFSDDLKKQNISLYNIVHLLTICYKNNKKVPLFTIYEQNNCITLTELSIFQNNGYLELNFSHEFQWKKAIIRHEIQLTNPITGFQKKLIARIDSGSNTTLAIKAQIAEKDLGLTSYGSIQVEGLGGVIDLKQYYQQVQLQYKDDTETEITTCIPVIELKSDQEEALIGLWCMEVISMELDVQKKKIYAKKCDQSKQQ